MPAALKSRCAASTIAGGPAINALDGREPRAACDEQQRADRQSLEQSIGQLPTRHAAHVQLERARIVWRIRDRETAAMIAVEQHVEVLPGANRFAGRRARAVSSPRSGMADAGSRSRARSAAAASRRRALNAAGAAMSRLAAVRQVQAGSECRVEHVLLGADADFAPAGLEANGEHASRSSRAYGRIP